MICVNEKGKAATDHRVGEIVTNFVIIFLKCLQNILEYAKIQNQGVFTSEKIKLSIFLIPAFTSFSLSFFFLPSWSEQNKHVIKRRWAKRRCRQKDFPQTQIHSQRLVPFKRLDSYPLSRKQWSPERTWECPVPFFPLSILSFGAAAPGCQCFRTHSAHPHPIYPLGHEFLLDRVWSWYMACSPYRQIQTSYWKYLKLFPHWTYIDFLVSTH